MNIPFNKPYTGKEEVTALTEALEKGHLHGDGPYTRRVQTVIENWLHVKHVLLTTSCTHALEMAMLTLDIGHGDEVIMPSFNFVSSANAVILRGATPVFADIQPETMNIDPAEIKRKITKKTKAIVPVHYAGVSCDMDTIMELAKKNQLFVIEDAAQAVGAYYKGKALGTIGDIGCFSFHNTKNITCGEGGAFVTNNDKIANKAEIIREKGTNRAAFIRGEVDKYTWMSKGSSYIPSDLLAALLEVQLQKRDEIKKKREEIWKRYYDALKPLANEGKITLSVIPEGCESNYHIFFFHVKLNEQQRVIKALKQNGIEAAFHYVPLHNSPKGREIYKPKEFQLPNTSKFSNTLIRLPLYPQLSEKNFYSDVKNIVHESLKNK